MRDQDDILRLVVVHVRCLDLANLLDQDIETRSEFSGRPRGLSVAIPKLDVPGVSLLATLAAVPPDIPLLVLVETTLLAQRSDVFGHTAFVVTGNAHISTDLEARRKVSNYP